MLCYIRHHCRLGKQVVIVGLYFRMSFREGWLYVAWRNSVVASLGIEYLIRALNHPQDIFVLL